MKKTIGSVGAVVLGVAAVVGCGSSSGGGASSGPDFAALRAEYTAPSGSLTSSDVLSVGKQLSTQESQSSNIPTSSASMPIGVRAAGRSPRPQDNPVTCSDSGGSVACSCGGGGTFDETIASSGSQSGVVEGTITYDSCVFDYSDGTTSSTESISGTMSYADYTTAPVMEIYSGSLSTTITPPGTTETVNFDYALVNGELTYSVSVSDGTVLVSDQGTWDESTLSGSFTVTDKAGTWTCNITDGHGTCTGSTGGTLTI